MNWLKEVSKILGREITEEDYDKLGSKEVLTIVKIKTEIFKNDISKDNLKELKSIAYFLSDFNNRLDHTNMDRIKTEDSLRIMDNFKRLFNLFKNEISNNVFDEIEGKFDKILEKLSSQRTKKEESIVEIIDPHFKDSIEKYRIDEYDLQDEIENNYPEVLENENIIRKVKLEINGFLMSLVLKRRGDVLEIVKGTIKKARR